MVMKCEQSQLHSNHFVVQRLAYLDRQTNLNKAAAFLNVSDIIVTEFSLEYLERRKRFLTNLIRNLITKMNLLVEWP